MCVVLLLHITHSMSLHKIAVFVRCLLILQPGSDRAPWALVVLVVVAVVCPDLRMPASVTNTLSKSSPEEAPNPRRDSKTTGRHNVHYCC